MNSAVYYMQCKLLSSLRVKSKDNIITSVYITECSSIQQMHKDKLKSVVTLQNDRN